MIFNLTNIPLDEVLKALPDEVAEMADVLPGEDFLKLVDKFSGQTIYIPTRPTMGSPLRAVIGDKGLAALGGICGGCDVSFPKLDALRRQYRNRRIAEDARQGMNNRKLSAKYKLTKRSISKILSMQRGEACR